MKYFKKILYYTLSLSLALTPTFSMAEDPRDTARKVISESHELARADARSYVKEDFMALVDVLTNEIVSYDENNGKIISLYQKYLSELQEEFAGIAGADVEQMEMSYKAVEAFMVRYEQAVRKQFAASWLPSEQQKSFENARVVIADMAKSFQKTCEVGRTNFDRNYIGGGFEVPEYISSLNGRLSFNPGFLLGGSPITWNYSYVSGTAGSEAANSDRARVTSAVVTASNIANSFWLGSKYSAWVASSSTVSGTTAASASAAGGAATSGGAAASSGGLMSSVSSSMVAAAPYLMAAAAVVIIVVSIMAQQEAYKLAKKVHEANNMLAEETANHQDVLVYYQDSCKQYSEILNEFVQVLLDLEGSETRATRLEKANKLKPELQTWEEASQQQTQEAYLCKKRVAGLYKDTGCTQADPKLELLTFAKNHIVDEKDPKTWCIVSEKDNMIFGVENECSLPFDEGERQEIVDEANKQVDEYNKKYPIEKITELVSAKLALVFQNQKAVQNQLYNASVEHIHRLQERAFANMMSYINITKKLKDDVEGVRILSEELTVQKQFAAFRDEALTIGSDLIKVVFNEETKAKFLEKMEDLSKRFRLFRLNYGHLKKVDNLARTINFMKSELQRM